MKKGEALNPEKPTILEFTWYDQAKGKANFPEGATFYSAGQADCTEKVDIRHDYNRSFPKEFHQVFDVVFMPHILEHFGRNSVIPVMKNVKELLKNGGEAWVTVHSLELVHRFLREDQVSPATLPMLYGPDTDKPHDWYRCAFTIGMLRQIFDQAGLVTREAIQQPSQIQIGKNMHDTLSNLVIGARMDEE